MLNSFLNFFKAPTFPNDEEKTRQAGIIYRVLLVTYFLLPTALVILVLNPGVGRFYFPVALVLVGVSTVFMFVTRRGNPRAASMAIVTAFIVLSAFIDFNTNGEPRPILILSAAVVVAGGLLLGPRGAYVTAILYSLKHIIVLLIIHNGWASPETIFPAPTPFVDAITTTVGYVFIAIIFSMASTNIYTALTRLRQSESALTVNNRQLQELTQTLEQRIEERTADLTAATAVSQRRARQFEAIARVSAEISSAQALDALLPRITQAISEQFDFYHVGIFFNDAEDQFAVLEAANSEGGQRMLKREHKLRIGAQGIVGYVTGTGLPRVAQNVGDDSVYFNNPDLPNTLTEMALPLKVGGKTIGALDVQSTESFAITNEDIASLSILADQVSIAIDNARLYESTRKSLEHTEIAYRQYVQTEWARFIRMEKISGFHYSNGASHPLESAQDLGEAARAVKEGKIHQVEAGESGPAQLAVPVKMRGKVVGILHISQQKKSHWTDDDIDIAEAVADRLALSIETARLFQVTAGRAARERIVSDFSTRISGNIRMDNILRTAAQELSQALNGSEVLIQLMKREPAAEVQE
jgi:GAF domain-containing protein